MASTNAKRINGRPALSRVWKYKSPDTVSSFLFAYHKELMNLIPVQPADVKVVLDQNEKWANGVHEGAENVRLTCTATGVPVPTLKWQKVSLFSFLQGD